jgi:diguanylate cyclase (GGDEF)-like protein
VSSASAASRSRYLLGLLAAILMLVGVGVVVTLGVQRFLRDAAWETKTHNNLELIAQLYSHIKEAEAAQRGYLITGRTDYLGDFYARRPEVTRTGMELRSAVTDDVSQSARAKLLTELIAQRMQTAEGVIEVYETEGFEAAKAAVIGNTGKRQMDEITALIAEIESGERRLLSERRAASDRSSDWLQIATIAGIAASIALMCLVFGFILRENRVRRIAEYRSEESSIELANTVMELRRIGGNTDELRHYAGMLQSCRSIEEAMEITQQSFQNLLPEVGGCIYLNRASQNFTEMRIRWGKLAAATSTLMPPDDCWALRRGHVYSVPDIHRASKCAHIELPPPSQPASTLCLPLSAQGETLGFLYLAGPDRTASDAETVAISAAEQLSLALCNLRLQESLRIQSIRDPLTGLYNRRYLEESLAREVARCGRRNLPLAVMMLDIDHFKRFNDTHGHDGGDALLAQFAALLQTHCRTEDIACRFGGEEFTVILPEVAPDTAAVRAEQIRAAVENLRVAHLKSQLSPVTVSIGLASYPRDGATGEEVLRAADVALYRAKHEGRNRFAVAAMNAPAPVAG